MIFDGERIHKSLSPGAEYKAIRSTNKYIGRHYPGQPLRDPNSHSCGQECYFRY